MERKEQEGKKRKTSGSSKDKSSEELQPTKKRYNRIEDKRVPMFDRYRLNILDRLNWRYENGRLQPGDMEQLHAYSMLKKFAIRKKEAEQQLRAEEQKKAEEQQSAEQQQNAEETKE